MASYNLLELSDHIERLETDNFGKFYLYAMLLHYITVRSTDFYDLLPRQDKTVVKKLSRAPLKQLNVGNIQQNTVFNEQLKQFQTEFIKQNEGLRAYLELIFLNYTERSKLFDLAFIIDKMSEYCNLLDENRLSTDNKSLYTKMKFGDDIVRIQQLLMQQKDFHHKKLASVIASVNSLLFSCLVILSLIIFLYAGITMLGAAMFFGGLLGATYYNDRLNTIILELKQSLIESPVDQFLKKDASLLSFFPKKSTPNTDIREIIVKPIIYADLVSLEIKAKFFKVEKLENLPKDISVEEARERTRDPAKLRCALNEVFASL